MDSKTAIIQKLENLLGLSIGIQEDEGKNFDIHTSIEEILEISLGVL